MSKDGLGVIITGSASGLGASDAAILARNGARIVINYASSQKEAEETADLCRAAGGEIVVMQGDVSRDEDCKKIAAAAAPWGRLDVLINNAGTTKHVPQRISGRPVGRGFSAHLRRQRDRTLPDGAGRAVPAGSRGHGLGPRVHRGQCIVGRGINGGGSSVAYAASKGALNAMTLSMARALAPLIRVNAICPGYIDTPWFTKGRGIDGAAKVRDAVVAKVPLKRASTAEDVAGVVCFLATQQSSNMTGEVLRIDAGAHLLGSCHSGAMRSSEPGISRFPDAQLRI